jgi:hypothetical protein
VKSIKKERRKMGRRRREAKTLYAKYIYRY